MRDDAIHRWLMGPPGRLVLGQGADILREWVPGVFGYRAAQLGAVPWPEEDPLETSPIRHRIRVEVARHPRVPGGLIADPAQLPFASDSLDLAVLPFTLDFCPDPTQVLREVERVLIPNGRLISLNFNPWSLWGLRRLAARVTRRPEPPWTGSFISYVRMNDWLNLLGLEVEQTDVAVFRPPAGTEKMLKRTEFLESPGRRFWPMLAGVYDVQAVKLVRRLTPLSPVRRRLAPFGSGVLEPTTRGM